MAKLTGYEKRARARERMLANAAEYTLGTYASDTADIFQRMIRAEAGACPAGAAPAIIGGELCRVYRRVGECVCVTCGKVGPWKGDAIGGGPIETGHFVASRKASILFEESNVHPQCKHCNRYLGGNQGNYELWMQYVYGPEEPDRLRRLKGTVRQFTREELVDMRIAFRRRLKEAEERMRVTQ